MGYGRSLPPSPRTASVAEGPRRVNAGVGAAARPGTVDPGRRMPGRALAARAVASPRLRPGLRGAASLRRAATAARDGARRPPPGLARAAAGRVHDLWPARRWRRAAPRAGGLGGGPDARPALGPGRPRRAVRAAARSEAGAGSRRVAGGHSPRRGGGSRGVCRPPGRRGGRRVRPRRMARAGAPRRSRSPPRWRRPGGSTGGSPPGSAAAARSRAGGRTARAC